MTSEHESPAVSDPHGIDDYASVWDASVPPGGEVCAVCGMPTETEPCAEHQPAAYAAMSAPALSPREAVARRLLALRALKNLVDGEEKKARAEAEALFVRAGQREPAELPDGTPLGNVRADKGTAAGWRVTDAGALRAWVEQVAPAIIVEQVTTVVDPEYVEDMLRDLNAGTAGGFTDTETGEIVESPPGVSYVKAGPPKLVVTGDKSAADAVRQWLAPALAQLEAGA